MWFGVITLFPEMLHALTSGITGRALKEQQITLQCWNPRDFAKDKHKSVDDKPYGGGPGMVMMAEPLLAAIAAAKQQAPSTPTVIYLSPQGSLFSQQAAEHFANKNNSLILIAGRYEGIDERVIELAVDEEWSIGNYVMTGGELPAMVMIDTITRLLPGVVGDEDSISQDSITSGLLKYPQYTRPEQVDGAKVPEILLSGNHQRIKEWRENISLVKTQAQRPDLLKKL